MVDNLLCYHYGEVESLHDDQSYESACLRTCEKASREFARNESVRTMYLLRNFKTFTTVIFTVTHVVQYVWNESKDDSCSS